MTDDEILMRPCVAADAADLAEMYRLDRDEIEAAEPSQPPAFFEVDGQLDRITRVWTEYRTLGFVAVERERIVGLFALEDVVEASAIVGYYVASDRRRQGVATSGLRWLIETAFRELGIRTLVVDIRPDNVGSLRVAERNGFGDERSVALDGVAHRRLTLRSKRTAD